MKKYSPLFLIPFLLLTGCTSHVAMTQQDKHEQSVALYEIRSELADLRHALSNTQVEIQLLEESIQKQESYTRNKMATHKADPKQEGKLAAVERRVETIEMEQARLSSHATQMGTYLGDYKGKISEIESALEKQRKLLTEALQLKANLASLTNSLQEDGSPQGTYKVKAGDSLEKIARLHKTSIGALKAENNLSHNTIIIGQELKIPKEKVK